MSSLPITALKFAQSLPGNFGALASDTTGVTKTGKAASLIEFSKATRVEPIVLVDQRVEHLPYMVDIMQSINSIFAGYYMLALNLSVNVGKIDTIKLLDRLNPSRDPMLGVFSGESILLQEDSYQTQLPFIGKPVGMENYGLEAAGDELKEVKENVNLSVGKMLNVTIGHGPEKASFPVNIRLIATTVNTDLIRHLLVIKGRDQSFAARYHLWRAGQIEFIRDLVLCQDLIDEHKSALVRDSKGQFAEILKRRRKNGLAALTSGNTSLATASSIVVLSDATRKEIERAEGFRFNDPKSREKMLEDTYTMLIVVVDSEFERVTIYHRSIAVPTELTVKQVKSVNSKSGGPDITDILNAYREGASPRLA